MSHDEGQANADLNSNADGSLLLCSSLGDGRTDRSARRIGAWSAPFNVGPPLNTQYNDMYAILTADRLTVYLTSDRPGGLGRRPLGVSAREH